MAEPDPAGVGGGGDNDPIFRGRTEVNVDYKDVTGLTKEMNALAEAIKRVHTGLVSLNEGKAQKALQSLTGIRGGKGGGAGSTQANGGGASFGGADADQQDRQSNGGFMGITRRQYAVGSIFAGASLIAGAYDRRAQEDLSSDVLAMRTVYTSDRPSFGLREATTYNAQQFGPYSLGRADAQQAAAASMGRYGMAGSSSAMAAARGAGVFAMGSLQGAGVGADAYNALNDPIVLNRMRMFTGIQTPQVTNVTGFASSMAKAAFGTATPTSDQLSRFRPGRNEYANMVMLSGGNTDLAGMQVELLRARARYEAMGSPRGEWNDSLLRNLSKDKGLQKDLFGGESSLYLSRQKFEAGKGMRQEELLNLSRSGLVTTNEWLGRISENTFKLTKHFEKFLGPLGNLLGGLGGGMGTMGASANILTDILTLRALTGGGGGGLRGLIPGGVRSGMVGTGGSGLTGAMGAAGTVGLASLGGQVIDSAIGNPKDKKGFDWGNVARYTAMGGGVGLAGGPLAPISVTAGLVGGTAVGIAREGWDALFGGDPIDSYGNGGVEGIGDPVPTPGGGMNVSQAEEILRARGGHTSGIAGLAADFKVKLGTLFAMNPKLSLSSGARSSAEQQRLYDRWMRKVPGQAPAAKPGTSNHEFGLAADIGPSSEYGWLAANAPKVGLVKPMSYEPWHWEPPGAKARRGQGGAPATGAQDDAGAAAATGPTLVASAVERVMGIGGAKRSSLKKAEALSGVALSAMPGGGMAVGSTQGSGAAGGAPGGAAGAIGINQAANYARQAGIPADQIATAVAIGMAESSLNPNAHNAVPPDDSYGIWQINMLGNMGPSRRKSLGIDSNDALFQPGINAKAMAMISGGGHNWRPWSTYTNGAYQGHMAAVNSALQSGVGDPIEPSSGGSSPAMPSLVMAGRGVGGGTQIIAPIYVTLKGASDEEARHFAAQVKRHLEGSVADLEDARMGL